MALIDLIQEFKRMRGVSRYVTMQKIREYVAGSDVYSIAKEIRGIEEPEDLNILLGVGMKGILWRAVVARQAYLEGVH